ncbi:glycoside hydrolase family 3 protein [Flindersiella endophytica]
MTSGTAEIAALVDRCLLIGMAGSSPAPEFRRWLEEGLGGIVLFRDNILDLEQLGELCSELHATATADLLIAADEEGGDVTRLYARTGSPHPGNLALGAVDDVHLTKQVAADIGNQLARLGVNLDLAPDADVNTNPDNPIIGTRSFGADPELVARHVVAYIEGLQSTGVAGSAKHFPGHGDTRLDSHLALPVVEGDLEPHLVPFRAAIAAGVKTILTAHIIFPELDDRPATLSPTILGDLLRGSLGFDGVVVTDSLTMAAISAQAGGAAEGAVQALAAGCDLLCMNSPYDEQRAVRDAVIAAVVDGRLPESRLADAASRVTALAKAHAAPGGGLAQSVPFDGDLARRLLHVDASLPLAAAPYVVELTAPRRGIDLTAGSLLAILQQRNASVTGERLHGDASGLSAAVSNAAGRPLVLVVRDAHRDERQAEAVASALGQRPDALVVGIGTTGDARLAPGHYLGTHGGARPNLLAAAGSLLG